MLDMLGNDGRLDPCLEALAARAGMVLATVKSCGPLGFLDDWARRLVRGPDRCEQASNAYVLRVPSCEAHFEPAVRSIHFKKERRPSEPDRQSAARQLLALGHPVSAGWLEGKLLMNGNGGPICAK